MGRGTASAAPGIRERVQEKVQERVQERIQERAPERPQVQVAAQGKMAG
jgi:hypothetical protein